MADPLAALPAETDDLWLPRIRASQAQPNGSASIEYSEGVLLCEGGCERQEVHRRWTSYRDVDVPRGQGAYSCEGPPYRCVDRVLGWGVSNSPSSVAARSVDVTTAMPSSTNARCAIVTVYRGEGSEG